MILPSDVRAALGPDSISVSEMGSLAGCEMKHHLTYGQAERPESAKSAAMALGTEVHRLVQAWRLTGEILESENAIAEWLIERYAWYYGDDDWTMGGVEIPFAMKLPAPWDGHLFGYMDGLLVAHNGLHGERATTHGVETQRQGSNAGLWLHEIKTMARWDRLQQLPVDRQVSLYIVAARAAGLPVRGVCFDAIRTHKPVRKEMPTAESFDRVWIERTEEELDDAVAELHSALELRRSLATRRPIRSVGQTCSWCSVVSTCYGLEVEVLPEDAA